MDREPAKSKRGGVIEIVRVARVAGNSGHAKLMAGSLQFACAIGPAGIVRRKREGDGATPAGRFRLLHGFFRCDHVQRRRTALPMWPIRSDDGTCDDPAAPAYNRAVRLPSSWGHERMWRTDDLYDIVIVVDHNRSPRVRGLGSAIFFHLARPDFSPTAGCVAISAAAMRCLLSRLSPRTVLVIG